MDIVPTNADALSETRNPFENTTPEVQASWELGYHDGLKSVPARCGRDALIAFAVGDRNSRLMRLGETLAEHKAQLGSAERRLEQLERENRREEGSILPAFGRQSIGLTEWLVVAFYLLLAVAAVAAEFPLSRVTVDEAIGTPNTASLANMALLRDYSIWALAIVLCLIGFSLKPLFDVLHRGRGHSRWEVILVVVSLIPCAAAIYGVAQLRESISNPALSMAVSSPGQHNQSGHEESVQAIERATQAAEDIRSWTAFTFKWVTIALPLFSAMCLIVSARQVHNYRRHNFAVRSLSENERGITGLDQAISQLRYSVENEQGQLELARKEDPYQSSFSDRSVAAYEHGRATGEADRDRDLPLYDQLRMAVGHRVRQ